MLHKFTILVGIVMMLGSILLWQRSMMVHYAYRQSALGQEKKKLEKEIHRLEVDIRHHTRPQVLYDYWREHQEEFDFQIRSNNRRNSEGGKPLIHFTRLKAQPKSD